jgi:putative heme iron utilization protein
METRERIRAAVRENPNQMTMLLARQFGVPEVEVLRAFPGDRAVELDPGRWEETGPARK